MRPLAVLARLAGLEVERERRALAALDERLDHLRREIAQAESLALSERQAVVDLAGARALALYLEAHRRRLQAAEAKRTRLEDERGRQLARLMAARLELKRLEKLQARLDRRRRAEALRCERRSLDELAPLTRRMTNDTR